MTRIVNLKYIKQYDIYGGRPSILGNSHPIGFCKICSRIHDRQDCIDEYRKDFNKRINNDVEFRNAVFACKDIVVACWCKPAACHCDIIVEFLDRKV